jgi:hypothetical protein
VVTPHFADLIRIRIFVKTKQNSSVLECTSACKSFNHPFQDAVLGFTSTNVDLYAWRRIGTWLALLPAIELIPKDFRIEKRRRAVRCGVVIDCSAKQRVLIERRMVCVAELHSDHVQGQCPRVDEFVEMRPCSFVGR